MPRLVTAAIFCVIAALSSVLAPAVASAQTTGLRISEIFYNPAGQQEGHEFVELTNVGSSTLDLGQYTFTSGIAAILPAGTSLAPGARIVGAADADAFAVVFGTQPDFVFDGSLSNGGETLTIATPAGIVAESVSYDDVLPWPSEADGDGDSLVRIDPAAPESGPAEWLAGVPTPGEQDQVNAAVRFSVERGWYGTAQTVTLESTIPGAAIVWGTTGDGNPTTPYTGPITVAANGDVQVVQAALVTAGGTSPVETHSYVFRTDAGVPVVLVWPNGRTVAAGEVESTRSFEFIPPPSTGLAAVGADAGMAASQGGVQAGESDKIFFRSTYGASTLDADLFSDRYFGVAPEPRHDQLFLRNNHSDPSLVRALITHDTQLAMGQLAPHGRLVSYVKDGSDVGNRHLLERPEGGFMESYTGIDKGLWRAWSNIENRFDSIYDQRWFGVPFTSWQDAAQTIDMQSFADFLLVNWQAATLDFYPNRNWRIAGPLDPATGDGNEFRFNFFSWDLDYAFDIDFGGQNWNANSPFQSPHHLLLTLDDYVEWRTLLSDRIACAFYGDGPLTANQWQARLAVRAPESAAAGQDQSSFFDPFAQWIDEKNAFLETEFRGTDDVDVGGVEPVAMPMLGQRDQLDATVTNGLLTVSPDGDLPVYYRLDGDPRNADGTLHPAAERYTGPTALPAGQSIVVARSHDASAPDVVEQWSPACNEGSTLDVAVAGAGVAQLAITELHYNPPTDGAIDGDRREFVEIRNNGAEPVSMANVRIDGIGWEGPAGLIVEPGEYLVLASDGAQFLATYGAIADGTYDGRLDDGGETLTMVAADGQIIDTVSYDDAAPWPAGADAGGAALALTTPSADNAAPSSWSATTTLTPGAANVFTAIGAGSGDSNCSTETNDDDARIVVEFLVGNRQGSPCPHANELASIDTTRADVDGDTQVTLIDALLIAQCGAAVVDDACP